ncbi:MAG: TolC family protein [Bryobacteraceae bacterium]
MNHTRIRTFGCLLGAWLAATPGAFAQSAAAPPEIEIRTPPPPPLIGPLLRPFHLERRQVAPARLTNSYRLDSLIRAGSLYLTAQDVIALTLENNLDIAVQRYGPYMAREALRRAEGGGLLRQDVVTPIAPGPVSVSPIGVSGNTSGLASGAGASTASFLTGYGPNPPNLDPSIGVYMQFGHSTIPETNLTYYSTAALVSVYRFYEVYYNQQFLTGTSINASYWTQHTVVNSPNNTLDPNVTGDIDFNVTQSLLQGFSRAVNDRNIKVARNNIKITNLNLKLQLITTVTAILNLYWDLVSFNDDARTKQQALATAQKLLADNRERVAAGALPAVEVTRAAAQVSASQEALLISQTNLAQQETVLKNALSRTGVENAGFDAVHVVPLDHIEIPKTEEIQPVPDLIQIAMANRPELEQSRISLESSKLNLRGTRNSLLPSLSVFADVNNQGLAGALNPQYNNCCGPASSYFVGGLGTALAQEFRRNFPNYSAGFSLNIPLRNRGAQADYAMDQLKLRQQELQLQRTVNQIRVEVKNAVVGLEQARLRYETAVNTRVLAEQSLDAEQKRFQYGATGADVTTVIQAQQDLANDQSAEIQALAAYSHAKIDLDVALGRTLDVNHIKLDEAYSGHVERQSVLPASLPGDGR